MFFLVCHLSVEHAHACLSFSVVLDNVFSSLVFTYVFLFIMLEPLVLFRGQRVPLNAQVESTPHVTTTVRIVLGWWWVGWLVGWLLGRLID